jgi:hypothetical protein
MVTPDGADRNDSRDRKARSRPLSGDCLTFRRAQVHYVEIAQFRWRIFGCRGRNRRRIAGETHESRSSDATPDAAGAWLEPAPLGKVWPHCDFRVETDNPAAGNRAILTVTITRDSGRTEET